MKKKTKNPSDTNEPPVEDAKQTEGSPAGITPAIPSGQSAYRYPTRMELLAFATAIHGLSPLPSTDKELDELLLRALELYEKVQLKLVHITITHPHLAKEPPPPVQMGHAEFVRYITGIKRKSDAIAALQEWRVSAHPERATREFLAQWWLEPSERVILPREALDHVRQLCQDDRARHNTKERVNSVTMRKCYAVVRKITGIETTAKAKAVFGEWKTHEATTGSLTGEGDALFARLHERFEVWWKTKQAGKANAKDARKSSRQAPKKT